MRVKLANLLDNNPVRFITPRNFSLPPSYKL